MIKKGKDQVFSRIVVSYLIPSGTNDEVRVYDRTETSTSNISTQIMRSGTWAQSREAETRPKGDHFGFDVDISPNGRYLIAGGHKSETGTDDYVAVYDIDTGSGEESSDNDGSPSDCGSRSRGTRNQTIFAITFTIIISVILCFFYYSSLSCGCS